LKNQDLNSLKNLLAKESKELESQHSKYQATGHQKKDWVNSAVKMGNNSNKIWNFKEMIKDD